MTFLRNKAAFLRWRRKGVVDIYKPAPKEYPCYVYEVVTSWAYEETEPIYLYQHDLAKMLAALAGKEEV